MRNILMTINDVTGLSARKYCFCAGSSLRWRYSTESSPIESRSSWLRGWTPLGSMSATMTDGYIETTRDWNRLELSLSILFPLSRPFDGRLVLIKTQDSP